MTRRYVAQRFVCDPVLATIPGLVGLLLVEAVVAHSNEYNELKSSLKLVLFGSIDPV